MAAGERRQLEGSDGMSTIWMRSSADREAVRFSQKFSERQRARINLQ